MRSINRLRLPSPGTMARWVSLAAIPLLVVPQIVDAQYFGRNKVQYDEFEFRVLETPHFDIHFYPEQDEAMRDVARMAERWYERLARVFQHEFDQRKPLIFYADHPDFQQTNTIQGHIGEGTGGVAESLKNRVIMPLAGSYGATDHVLGHEIVHAFQYDLAQTRRGGGMQGLMRIPLWMIEGMAEYLSVGREDPLTGMWLRDAVLRDDFPTLQQLTREARFFPYRFGQAFWTYVGGTYGDEVVVQLFRTALRTRWDNAVQQVLGMDADSLSAEWRVAVEEHYRPLMEGRTAPGEVGTLLLSPATGAGQQNVAPSVSPDGRYLAFMSEKDLFSVDLFLADARTGEIIRRLSSADSDPHFDALRFIDSSGAWSPDSRMLAFVVFAQGRNQIVVQDVESGRVMERIDPGAGIGEITSPDWSMDGERLVFSGQVGGFTELFEVELASGEIERLTDDRHAAYQPTYSPDGRYIAFAADRGSETDFDDLVYSRFQISLYDRETGEIETLDLFGNVRHSNPQFSPDGRALYFLSDNDGFSDIYRLDMEDGEIRRVTEVATAVSGISANSPAMTVAREAGTVLFSVFDEFQFHIYSLDLQEAPDGPVVARSEETAPGRMVPPAQASVASRVDGYLQDARTGLVERGTYEPAEARGYDPSLSLDYIGQPAIGVGTDRFGNYVGGSAAAFFSDMLGDRMLGVAVQAQGELQDIGGQMVYQNRAKRWNWGLGASRIPYIFVQTGLAQGPRDGEVTLFQDIVRTFESRASGMVSYPFSSTRRMDLSLGATRYSYGIRRDSLAITQGGLVTGFDRYTVREGLPDPLNLAQASVALVGDNSFFGFTSPVRGSRYRLELQSTMGSLDFQSVIADFRRYFNPRTQLTFAVRGMHFGRYGGEFDETAIRPVFLGTETFMRGYAWHTFDQRECVGAAGRDVAGCPAFDRLFGQRIGVANAEMRVPLVGVERYGMVDFGFLPTELVLFADAGVAWSRDAEPALTFERRSDQRIPVFSTGVSTRLNVLGALVLEIYYAYPFQRPEKGAHWGFQIAPGW